MRRMSFLEAAPLFCARLSETGTEAAFPRLGYGRLRPALTQLRVRTPKRVIVPLSVDAVARFWSSFRTSRDLAIVGLMLLLGLRSCEVLALNREDVQFQESRRSGSWARQSGFASCRWLASPWNCSITI